MAPLNGKKYLQVPCNIEAEQAVLGAVLMNNEAFARVSDMLTEFHFHEPAHRRIWGVIRDVISTGRVANPITLRPFVGEMELGGMTVQQYLARLAAEAVTVSGVRDYAQIVRDMALRREMIDVSDTLRDLCYEAPADMGSERIMAKFESMMGELRPRIEERPEFEGFADVSLRAIESASQAYQNHGRMTGISTGFERLDEALGGLQKTDLIILAGRTGVGKSAMAVNIAFNVARAFHTEPDADGKEARAFGGRVGIFSLEMGADQLARRIISARSGIPDWRIRRGLFNEGEFNLYVDAQRELREIPLRIDESGELTIAQLRMRARRLAKRYGLDLLVVDYLQLLSGTSSRRDNRVQEVTEITTGLKALAKELNVPIIALSQLNREVDKRDDKRPIMSDLRESGSIEQDADVILFVYREEYYARQHKPKEGSEALLQWEDRLRKCQGQAEAIIAKQRNGPAGSVELGWDGELTCFLNEPPARQESLLGMPEKKAQIRLAKESVEAWGTLRGLTATSVVDAKGLASVPYGARPVPYDIWKAQVCGQLLDPDHEPKTASKLMEKIVLDLRHAGLVSRGGTREKPYVWLTTKGQ